MPLLQIFNPVKIICRNISKRQFIWYNEGIQYPGFKYYPRYPDFEDPPYEPTKLFRVEVIKPLKGAPYWEKHILKEFKLDGKKNSYVIVKNIPENNQRLWKIKHMIKITPITFPDGFPKEDDITYLQENGELKIIKKVNSVHENKLEISDNFRSDVKRLDGDTLRRQSRLKWLSGWDSP
ncbi:39S ribosomal protein L30, mitochondrial [Diorhabda carinulata]|uniref:39S ribosomal protein L30, mitochondrial n=1 Tax=Diorhabda sublineata TaxID=1163346 RepID=UPI0024E12109|nr:39S ribosomal protein L30, mitochondrial [Diorhabda sublineata]XP_057656090.1 39S ribosomal protein L30, mitochondrial [Diorhabda carinulata]